MASDFQELCARIRDVHFELLRSGDLQAGKQQLADTRRALFREFARVSNANPRQLAELLDVRLPVAERIFETAVEEIQDEAWATALPETRGLLVAERARRKEAKRQQLLKAAQLIKPEAM